MRQPYGATLAGVGYAKKLFPPLLYLALMLIPLDSAATTTVPVIQSRASVRVLKVHDHCANVAADNLATVAIHDGHAAFLWLSAFVSGVRTLLSRRLHTAAFSSASSCCEAR